MLRTAYIHLFNKPVNSIIMQFDPENKVIKLCAEGMKTEALGRAAAAHEFFKQAWDMADNNFEKFIAAHYLARNQQDPEENLAWNLKALHYAKAAQDENIKSHFPSLYLNLGKSYETLGDMSRAAENYQLALTFCNYLPAGSYADVIKSGINEGLKRSGIRNFENSILDNLIDKWCRLKELRPLSLVLPSYLGNSGSESDTDKLVSALSFLNAAKCLDTTDRESVEMLIKKLSEK